MEYFENFTEMWKEKGEMLKEIGCTERAAHAIWAWGIECGRTKNLQQSLVSGSLPTKDVERVMRWLLGYAPSFPKYTEGEGMYYWRKSLRAKIKKELKMVIGNDS